jgi:hypothetical protein
VFAHLAAAAGIAVVALIPTGTNADGIYDPGDILFVDADDHAVLAISPSGGAPVSAQRTASFVA